MQHPGYILYTKQSVRLQSMVDSGSWFTVDSFHKHPTKTTSWEDFKPSLEENWWPVSQKFKTVSVDIQQGRVWVNKPMNNTSQQGTYCWTIYPGRHIGNGEYNQNIDRSVVHIGRRISRSVQQRVVSTGIWVIAKHKRMLQRVQSNATCIGKEPRWVWQNVRAVRELNFDKNLDWNRCNTLWAKFRGRRNTLWT